MNKSHSNLFINRHRARKKTMQAIYQWQINDDSIQSLISQFCEQSIIDGVEKEYFEFLTVGIIKQFDVLDEAIKTYLDREINKVDYIEHAALLIGVFELKESPNVPYKVVIDEAIEMVKLFGAGTGHTIVNAVLDKLARKWRQVEQ